MVYWSKNIQWWWFKAGKTIDDNRDLAKKNIPFHRSDKITIIQLWTRLYKHAFWKLNDTWTWFAEVWILLEYFHRSLCLPNICHSLPLISVSALLALSRIARRGYVAGGVEKEQARDVGQSKTKKQKEARNEAVKRSNEKKQQNEAMKWSNDTKQPSEVMKRTTKRSKETK